HYHELCKGDEPAEGVRIDLEKIRKSLITYNPTNVGAEIEEKDQDRLDEYHQTCHDSKFTKSEAYDLGFYVGQQCGLTTVRAVDWMEIEQNQNGISDAVEWAETHDEEFITKLKNLQSNHNLINTKEHIYDITLELNKPE